MECFLGCTYEQQHLVRGVVAGVIVLVCFAMAIYFAVKSRRSRGVVTLAEHDEKPTTKTASKKAGARGEEIEITPEMITAGVRFVVEDFYPAEWGGKRGISELEARLLVRQVLQAVFSANEKARPCG